MKTFPSKNNLYNMVFRGEDDDKGGDDKGGDAGEKTFTQAELEKIVQKRVGSLKESLASTETRLETLSQSKTLTEQEAEELRAIRGDLEKQLLTKEEQMAKAEKEAKERFSKDLEKERTEKAEWQTRYTEERINTALHSAASATRAHSNEQIVQMFRGNTRLVPVKDDDGRDTNRFQTQLTFRGKLDEGAEIGEITLPVEKALEKIKADGLNPNLFAEQKRGGTGNNASGNSAGNVSGPPRAEDYSSPADFQKAYRNWKKNA